jgi:hypothetical protein
MARKESILTRTSRDTVIGIFLVISSTILLLSGLGFIFDGRPIISAETDTVLAFIALAFGLIIIFNEQKQLVEGDH